MSYGSYPPGVTGNEYAIAGPDYEQDSDFDCPKCEGPLVESGYRAEHWVNCMSCGFFLNYDDPTDLEYLIGTMMEDEG